MHEPLPLPSRPDAAASPAAGGRRVWLLIEETAQADELQRVLAGDGWRVEQRLEGLEHFRTHLDSASGSGKPLPDLLVCGLRFEDGDAFALIRLLAAMPPERPMLYFTSRQQRAMFRSAAAMAAACGVQVAGFAEKPVAPARIAAELRGLRRAPAPRARPAAAELAGGELRALLGAGRLQAWMQPKMRLASREVTGFEALMRGFDAEGRLVTPDRLVPALSRHGLLEEATLAMVGQSAGFVAGLLEEGLPVSCSVNASLQSLSDPLFCRELSRSVQRSGLDPSWITIEITETDAMSDLSMVIENTSRIRLLGFNLAIDDFGTGYSSLFQLSQIPFSELKIERLFVSGMEDEPTKQQIVHACAYLSSSLGLKSVAEGVETPAELRAVQAAGCTEVQGFLLARPMPVESARAWLLALDGLRIPPSTVPVPDGMPSSQEISR